MSIRIQFDLSIEEWERLSRYIPSQKLRHAIAKEALNEWCTRREGRDKKLITDRRIKEAKEIEPLILDILKSHGIMS